jgi:hypothetical protein
MPVKVIAGVEKNRDKYKAQQPVEQHRQAVELKIHTINTVYVLIGIYAEQDMRDTVNEANRHIQHSAPDKEYSDGKYCRGYEEVQKEHVA